MSGRDEEVPLSGGAQAVGIVRVGSTVRRPRHAQSDYVQTLLGQLAAAGFAGAPRPLGYDNQGREVVSFIDGRVPTAPPFNLSDDQLRSATDLILATSWG